jgi:hypothetical protein
MRSVDEIKTAVRDVLAGTFPQCLVQFEPAGDDPTLIGVGVYGVDKQLVGWVETKIMEVGDRLLGNSDLVLIPLVRDEETTARYYPHLLPPGSGDHRTAHCATLGDPQGPRPGPL